MRLSCELLMTGPTSVLGSRPLPNSGTVLGFPAKIFVGSDDLWVLDPLHRTLLAIPIAEIGSANAEETAGKWAFRICWSGGQALFAYDGIFAERHAQAAQETIRDAMRQQHPAKPLTRAAGAGT